MEKKVNSVTAKVQSVKGSCWHKVGDSVTITETGVEGKICLHALYSLLPKAFAMMYGAHFPWLQDQDVAVHACPDPNNPVVFEITRHYKG